MSAFDDIIRNMTKKNQQESSMDSEDAQKLSDRMQSIVDQISSLRAEFGLDDASFGAFMDNLKNVQSSGKSERVREAYANATFDFAWDDKFLEGKRDVSLSPIVVPESFDEKRKAHLLAISAMPENTPDEVLAKGFEIQHFVRPDTRMSYMSEDIPESIHTLAAYNYVASFHDVYDMDGGESWRKQEESHPLEGISQSVTDETYMTSFGSDREVPVHVIQPKYAPQYINVNMSEYGLPKDLGFGVLYASFEQHDEEDVLSESEHEETVSESAEASEESEEESVEETSESSSETEEESSSEETAEAEETSETGEESPAEESASSEGTEENADDSRTLDEILDEEAKLATGENGTGLDDNGMIHYDGVLGKFDYNPTEFRVMLIDVEPEYDDDHNPIEGTGGQYPVLRYIGDDVDGKNIHIPEGLEDGSMMFDGNQALVSAPDLPKSLKTSFAMFRGCSNMTIAMHDISPELTDAQFMYADCKSLVRGPRVIPGTVEDGTAMFANCESLIEPAKLREGIKCTDSMFANCKSLEKKPNVPYSVEYADYMTEGCTGIDKAEREKAEKVQAKSQKKYEKQLNRRGLGDHLGSVFSAMMQVRLVHKSGHSLLSAMWITHQNRKRGVFDKSAASGWEAYARTVGKKNFAYVVAKTAATNSKNRQLAIDRKNAIAMQSFTETRFGDKDSSKDDRINWMTGRAAGASGYFERVGRDGYPMAAVVRQDVKNTCESYRNQVELMASYGDLSPKDKTALAKEMVEMVSNQTAYYRGAMSSMEQSTGNPQRDALREKGINTAVVANMGELFGLAAEMQEKYQLFNERQLALMYGMAYQTPYSKVIKSEEGKKQRDAMYGQFTGQERATKMQVDTMGQSNVRSGYKSRHGERGDDASRRFDFGGSSQPPVAEYEA